VNRHSFDASAFCPGCGTYYATHGEHRVDCTSTSAFR
jgi:ribosomal protein S27AE